MKHYTASKKIKRAYNQLFGICNFKLIADIVRFILFVLNLKPTKNDASKKPFVRSLLMVCFLVI